MARYKITKEDDNFYTIANVPIFSMHTDRGFPCNEEWMTACIQNHKSYKLNDHRPPIILGHNRPNQTTEKEAVGFLDNLVLKGKQLYADLVRVPKHLKEKIIQNAYPSRSVEVLPKSKRIVALALLGGTTPHFALPQMSYESEEMPLWYRSPEMKLDPEVQKAIATTVQDAMKTYAASTADQLAEGAEGAEEPQLFTLSRNDVTQIFESEELPAIYQDEETGVHFSIDEQGNQYQWPTWAVDKLNFEIAAAGNSEASEGYDVDWDTGEVYQDGNLVGQVVPTTPKNVSAVPGAEGKVVIPKTTGTGTEEKKLSPLGTAVPTITGDDIQVLKRDDSAQFEEDVEAEVYDLNRRLETVENANALLRVGKQAEAYKKYLRAQKAAGAPVGDIDKIVDYLLSQSVEQVAQYKAVLEGSPKVDLGSIADNAETVITNAVTTDVKQDYATHKKAYTALGVEEADLKYASFVTRNNG